MGVPRAEAAFPHRNRRRTKKGAPYAEASGLPLLRRGIFVRGGTKIERKNRQLSALQKNLPNLPWLENGTVHYRFSAGYRGNQLDVSCAPLD